MKDIKFGNNKLPNNTLIINMGSATHCPSAERALCDLAASKSCYALRDENQYPQPLPYRNRQQEYWLGNEAETIAFELLEAISHKRSAVKYVRWNEAGDLHGPECVEKLIKIAKLTPNLVHYLYTHRTDLLDDLTERPRNLVVQVSTSSLAEASEYTKQGFNSFFTDTTISIAHKKDTPTQTAHELGTQLLKAKHGPKALICKWDCSICSLCKVNGNKVIHICLH